MSRFESKKLRDSIRGMNCLLNIAQTCQYIVADPTVVPCHAPSEGKGVGIRSSDAYIVAGCHDCHSVLDRRAKYPLTGAIITEDEARFYWLRGMQRQLAHWIDKGVLVVE